MERHVIAERKLEHGLHCSDMAHFTHLLQRKQSDRIYHTTLVTTAAAHSQTGCHLDLSRSIYAAQKWIYYGWIGFLRISNHSRASFSLISSSQRK